MPDVVAASGVVTPGDPVTPASPVFSVSYGPFWNVTSSNWNVLALVRESLQG